MAVQNRAIGYWRGLMGALRGKSYPVAIAQDTNILSAIFGTTTTDDFNDYYSKIAAVYACVRKLATNVAMPPLVVYERGRDGSAEAVDSEHPLQVLLNKVNPWWTRPQFWRATETSLALHGNAFWTWYGPGRLPTEIWWLDPTKTRAIPGKQQYITGYEYRNSARIVTFAPEQMLWLRYHNPADEYGGLSPLSAARMAAEAGYDAMAWNRNFFKNDATPGRLYIKSDQDLTAEQAEEIKLAWTKSNKGVDNAHRVAVFGRGADLKTTGISQRDMEFLAMQRWTLEDICRIYGVPPPLVADLERATYSNIKEAKASFWHETILPELLWVRDEVNESALLPLFGDNLFCDFDLSNVEALQEDANQKAARYQMLVTAGIKTINEVRAEQNLDPVPWGDAWWTSIALTPVSSSEAPASYVPPPEPQKYMRRAIDEDARLDVFVKRLTPMERKFQTFLRAEFDREQAEILANLQKRKALPAADIADWDDIIRRLEQGGRPYLLAMLESAAADAAVEMGINFDLQNPRVQRWLGERLRLYSYNVTETTKGAITEQLRLAEAAGESADDAAKRIMQVFDQASRGRAERIARTEMVSASNRGALEAYKQSGVVEKKVWLAAQDERTRPSHAKMHHVEVLLDADFVVGADLMQAPGEGRDPAENINCRCTLAPVVMVRESMKPLAVAAMGGNGHGKAH
uniref:Putative portal protein n=1 Tax=viral metagenome TaxID=1070528 RepID=A0A6M3IG21_9ZZZZ